MSQTAKQSDLCPICGAPDHHPTRFEECPNVESVESRGRRDMRIKLKDGRTVEPPALNRAPAGGTSGIR